jgi:FdrA protein
VKKNLIIENRFYDSVFLMQIASKVQQLCGVDSISVLMGTESNKGVMRETDILTGDGEKANPNDLVIAIIASSQDLIDTAFNKVQELLSTRETKKESTGELPPRSLAAALDRHPEANIAFFSLPGPFVRYEAQKALEKGLSLMIFSDNVPLEDEVELKKLARDKGLLVMGPDCGTAIIGGKAMGFANVVKSGPVGIVGASGTGIQEISVLLSTHGVGISHAIGIGSNDLSKDVQGISMLTGMSILAKDPGTEIILLISKPPDKKVAEKIIAEAAKIKKPVLINFLSAEPIPINEKGLESASTLEEAIYKTLALVKKEPYTPRIFDQETSEVMAKAQKAWEALDKSQHYIRGLYSGGTLCEEALIILHNLIGGVHSNTKVYPELRLKNARVSQGHSLVDIGDDEFTRGTPHPMIDYNVRKERMIEEAKDKEVAVFLLDVVLGYGSHPDPASELVPAIKRIRQSEQGKRIAFVATIIGTEEDPQNIGAQIRHLEDAGVIVFPSNAQAARFAALIATRGEVSAKLLHGIVC